MGMGLELSQTLRPELAQHLVAKLEQRLKLHVGNVERQLLAKVEFANVDFESPRSRYHLDMLGEFVMKEAEEQPSLASRVLLEHGYSAEQLEKIVIESFDQEDVSFDIGTKRNVDAAHLVLENGQSLTVSLSLDKRAVTNPADSPSLQEASALSVLNDEKMWSVQRYYGSSRVEKKDKFRGFIVKEFLPGSMLGNYLSAGEGEIEPDRLKRVAFATGQSFANSLERIHGLPKDANPMNLIVDEREDGTIVVRNCDVEGFVSDPAGIEHELKAIRASLGPYAADFDRGLQLAA